MCASLHGAAEQSATPSRVALGDRSVLPVSQHLPRKCACMTGSVCGVHAGAATCSVSREQRRHGVQVALAQQFELPPEFDDLSFAPVRHGLCTAPRAWQRCGCRCWRATPCLSMQHRLRAAWRAVVRAVLCAAGAPGSPACGHARRAVPRRVLCAWLGRWLVPQWQDAHANLSWRGRGRCVCVRRACRRSTRRRCCLNRPS